MPSHIYLATTDAANTLLQENPFALLTGMLLDQRMRQVLSST